MTISDFFELLSANPGIIIAYFILIPLTAFIAGLISKENGYESPWKYFYSALIYLVCVPGIFALALSAYVFLFEQGRSVFQTNIFTQILPILSMLATLGIIRQRVNLDYIPGFDKLSGLFIIILIMLGIMWGLDRTRIFVGVFSRMPFAFVLLIFLGGIALMTVGWKRFSSKS